MRTASFRILIILCLAGIALASCSLLPRGQLSNIRMTTDDTGSTAVESYNPLQTFCVFADAQGIKAGSVIRAIWVAVDAQGVAPNTKINTSDYTYLPGVKHVFFKLSTWDDSNWPVGSYQVKLFLDGAPVGEQSFAVK
jgi:hypothetical protein